MNLFISLWMLAGFFIGFSVAELPLVFTKGNVSLPFVYNFAFGFIGALSMYSYLI